MRFRHNGDIWILYLLAFVGGIVILRESMLSVVETYRFIKRGFASIDPYPEEKLADSPSDTKESTSEFLASG